MKNLWISLPISLICLFAQAQTTTTTTASTPAPTAAKAPAKTTAPGAATTSAVNTSVAAAPTEEPKKSVSFGLGLGAEYGWQAQQQPDGTRGQSMTYNIAPTMSYGDYTLKSDQYFEQDLIDSNASQSEAWTDPNLILSKKSVPLGQYFKFGPSATVVFPMKDSSRNAVGALYTVSGAATISVNTKALNMDAWSFGYQISATRYFTQFETRADNGNPNAFSRLRNRLTFGYQIMDKLSFFNLFDFNSNYSVNGVVTNSFFSLQSIGYDLTDSLNISVGHANSGSVLKAKTYENNLKMYDEKGSFYSLGLSLSI